MVAGIPISAIAVAAGSHPAGAFGLVVVWVAIAAINLGYAISPRGLGRQASDRFDQTSWDEAWPNRG